MIAYGTQNIFLVAISLQRNVNPLMATVLLTNIPLGHTGSVSGLSNIGKAIAYTIPPQSPFHDE